MAKINLTINLSALDKSKIIERKYKNKEGQEVTVKEYKADLVELLAPQFVTEGDTWTMNKTHFLADPQTKQERDMKVKSNFIGEGFQFSNKELKPEPKSAQDINLDDMAF